jgi:hypothetical protein
MSRRLLLPASLIIAQLSNLLLQLMAPRLLPPAEFSKFSLVWSYGQFALVLSFEWLRVSVIRFSHGSNFWLSRKRRLIFKRFYLLVTAGLLVAMLAGVGLSRFWAVCGMVAAVCVFAACRGLFDGSQAFARAASLDREFVLVWTVSSMLSLILTIAIAWATKSGVLAVYGLALSYVAALWFCKVQTRIGRAKLPRSQPSQSLFLFRYGVFVALSGAISAALNPFVRSVAVAGAGAHGAAGIILAMDLSQKVVAAIGMVLNVFLLHRVILAAEFESKEEVGKTIGRQISVLAAILFPVGIGFALLQPSVSTVLVPQVYRASYLDSVLLISMSAAISSFRSYAIDTQFVAAGSSSRSFFGPLATVFACGVSIAIGSLWLGFSLRIVAAGLLLGTIAGVGVATYMTRGVLHVEWPIRDLGIITFACAVLCTIAWGLGHGAGVASDVAIVGLAGSSYLLILWLFDVVQIRSRRIETLLVR